MSKKYDHLHKYKRVKMGKSHIILRCMLPLCSHYLPHINLALGKMCACATCGEAMIIDKVSIKHANPHCDKCIKRRPKELKDVQIEQKLEEFLREKLG